MNPTPPTGNYNVIEKIKKTLAQIYTFELLQTSLAHKAILDKVLHESVVSRDINEKKFQAMVKNLVVAPHVDFTEYDILTDILLHNVPLHLEVVIHNKIIKRVLIDGGASLNICTLNMIKALRYLENYIDPTKKIRIKAYDDEEHPSKGVVTLPVQVGLVITESRF